jgi:hypothetical protein
VFASVVLMLTSVWSVVVGNIFSLRLIRSRQGKSLSQPGSYAHYCALLLERLTYDTPSTCPRRLTALASSHGRRLRGQAINDM